MNQLAYIEGRVVCTVDVDLKQSHTFGNGQKIFLDRRVQNFNRRITEATNATVISAEHIPAGAEVLIHHNATHDTYRIFDYKKLSGEEEASTVKYFSIPETECYVYRIKPEDEWTACYGFVIGLRVYKPYDGLLEGLPPTLMPNMLYMTSGEYQGEVVQTLKNSDYQIIFQDSNGQENSLIRCRHFEGPEENDREEIIAIRHDLIEQIEIGKLLVGISISDATTLNEYNDRKTSRKSASRIAS